MECLPLVSSLSSSPSGPAATTSCLYPPHFPVIAVAMGIVTHMPAMQPYAHTRCDLQPSSCAPMFNRETFHTDTGMICMLCALLAADKKALVVRCCPVVDQYVQFTQAIKVDATCFVQ
jgi:hypothetical protein